MSRTTPAKSGKESGIHFGQKRERKITTTATTTCRGGGRGGGGWFPAVVHFICMSSMIMH